MKNIFKIILMFICFGMMDISCSGSEYSYLKSIVTSESDYEDPRRTRRGGGRAQNECEDSDRCQNICDQLFEYSQERVECYSLSLRDIGIIEEIFDILKTPNRYDLDRDISARDFELFAEFGLNSWNRLIQGEYRQYKRDEDDDDEDDDDKNSFYEEYAEYGDRNSSEVLYWMISKEFVGEFIRDFDNSSDILYNLFLQLSSSDSLSLDLNMGDNDGKEVFKGLIEPFIPSLTYNYLLLIEALDQSDDVLALYELTHNMISEICETADIDGKSRENSYKICLSWVYFVEGNVSFTDPERGVGRYLLNDSYRRQPEPDAVSNDYDKLVDFDNWSDYWN